MAFGDPPDPNRPFQESGLSQFLRGAVNTGYPMLDMSRDVMIGNYRAPGGAQAPAAQAAPASTGYVIPDMIGDMLAGRYKTAAPAQAPAAQAAPAASAASVAPAAPAKPFTAYDAGAATRNALLPQGGAGLGLGISPQAVEGAKTIGRFALGALGFAPSPTQAVSVPPVAQTPAGPAPVTDTSLRGMSNGALPGGPVGNDGLTNYQRTAMYTNPGTVKGPDGITLGVAPARPQAAQSGQVSPQSFDDYLKDKFMNAGNRQAQQFWGQMLQHTFSPAYQAQKEFRAIGANHLNNALQSIETSQVLNDAQKEKARQDALTYHLKTFVEPLGTPGLIPYSGGGQGLVDPTEYTGG